MRDENDETVAGHCPGKIVRSTYLAQSHRQFRSLCDWQSQHLVGRSWRANWPTPSDIQTCRKVFIGSEETCKDETSLCGVQDFDDMAQRLHSRRYENLTLHKRIFAHENHGTVVNPGYDKELEQVFKAEVLPRKYSF